MDEKPVSKHELELCLNKVLASDVFSGAARMQTFLRYVVEETLKDRGSEIKGKTIALDVYSRNASTDGDPENVVRVDARRLRRRLSDYYQTEGRSDPIRIHIDSGGYAPRFEVIDTTPPIPPLQVEREIAANKPRWKTMATMAVCAAALLSGLFVWSTSRDTTLSDAPDLKKFERQALLEKSAASLQAVNVAEQAKGMIFPLFSIERQKLAYGMFKQAVSLDPDYSGGHAGAAQSLSSMAILTRDPDQKALYLETATNEIQRSIILAPTDAWTQASAAWVAFAKGDFDRSFDLSKRAYALDPDDWYVADIHGLIALFSGNFTEAGKVSDPSVEHASDDQRSASRNIYAAASFHLGMYEDTLIALQDAGELGGPISPPRLAYQAAAKHALGDLEGARNAVIELMESWPGSRIDILLEAFFSNSTYSDDVVMRLREAGWTVGN